MLAVSRVDCFRTARTCTPGPAPDSIAMLGIGFGREGDHQAQSTPDRNPFLNLAPGGAGHGYVVTRTGVHVGLGEAERRDFATVRLARSTELSGLGAGTGLHHRQQRRPRLRRGADGYRGDDDVSPCHRRTCRQPRWQPTAWRCVLARRCASTCRTPPRRKSATRCLPATGPTRSPPTGSCWCRTPTAFVNTSVRFLNGFDFLFDADQGLVGYRRRQGP